jgi:6-phosphogluconolactonase
MAKRGLASVVLMATAVGVPAVASEGDGYTDHGAVYTLTNSTTANAVAVYDRAPDGTLTMSGSFSTHGISIGFFATGNQHGLLLSNKNRCLWAVNSMSDSIASFEVKGTSLTFVDTVASGGSRPISLTVNEGLGVLYVLNAGGQVGASDNITGFTLGTNCKLSPLAGSTRALSGSNVSPAQVSLTPKGSVLIVTEKTDDSVLGQPAVRGGHITTWQVDRNGLLSARKSFVPPITEPFGFAFDDRGQMLVTAADCTQPAPPGNLPGCTVPPNTPALLTYKVGNDGTLKLLHTSVDDQAAKCWIVVTGGERFDYGPQFAFTTNALATPPGGTAGAPPAGSITGYEVGRGGRTTKLGVTPVPLAPVGVPVDAALSRDSRFLYVLTEGDGLITAYKIGADGGLTLLNSYAVTSEPPITAPASDNVPFPNGLAAQ